MPTKVLYLEHNIDGTVGGSHLCLLEICRHLDRSRFDPLVWFFQDNSLVERFRETGAEVVIERPPMPIILRGEPGVIRRRLRAAWQSVVNARRVFVSNRKWWEERVRQRGVGLVHLNNSAFADVDLQLACRHLGVPCVAHQRGFPPESGWIARRVARSLRAIIAISSSIQADLRRRGIPSTLIRLIFDGVDPARIEACQPASDRELEELGVRVGAPLIGIVGNVKRWKGQEVVVKAMTRLRQTHPDVTCLIIGAKTDQKYFDGLVGLCRAEGLTDAIKMIGYHPNPATLMSRMDVVLHASIQPEPFGIVLLEAMALGRPVVAARAGGPTDIVVPGVSGELFTPGNAVELAECVSRLLDSAELRLKLGSAGRARMQQVFTAKANIDRLHRLYEELLDR